MRTIFVLLGLLAASVTVKAQTLTSPDGNFKMQFHLSDEGKPVYSLIYKEKEVIKESKMGFQISPSIAFDRNFSVVETKIDSCNTVWNTVWGQKQRDQRPSQRVVGGPETRKIRQTFEYPLPVV